MRVLGIKRIRKKVSILSFRNPKTYQRKGENEIRVNFWNYSGGRP